MEQSASSSDHLEFPSLCPKCGQHEGQVRSASTVPRQPMLLRLTICCQNCKHEWIIDKGNEWEAKPIPYHGLQNEPYT